MDIEIEKIRHKELKDSFKSEFHEQEEDEILLSKSKTSNRIHYEAQVEVIKKQIGSLENVRLNLGLSARKICQLLLVDPSAWSRWKKDMDAPPHVWRALQWYLIISEKIPGLTPQYFIGKNTSVIASELKQESDQKFLDLKLEIDKKVRDLEKALALQKKMTLFFAVLTSLILAILFIKMY